MAHHRLRGRKRPGKHAGVRQELKNERKKRENKKLQKKLTSVRKEALAAALKAGDSLEKATAKAKLITKAALVTKSLATNPAAPKAAAKAAAGAAKKDKKAARQQAANEKCHRGLYPPGGGRLLLVGEGNFSFARALCRHLKSGAEVIATAYDSEAMLKQKYPDAAECRKEVEETFGGTTLVGVDATRLHQVREFRESFTTIVWNFPHTGSGETDVEKSIEEHQRLLVEFLNSALRCLDPEKADAAIHIALKSGEPYKSWKLVKVARAACPGLELRTAVPFAPSAWTGYEHRRTRGFDERFSKKDNEELQAGAKVFIFARRKAAAEEA